MKTALVTGASRGIGAAVTERLIAAGYHVLGVCREPGRARDQYTPHSCDLSDCERASVLVQSLAASHDIDVFVANAGVGLLGGLEQLAVADITRVLALNLTSPILMTRAIVPTMKRRQRGDIVFIGSEAAIRGGKRGTVYCASKFGLRGFAQALRDECRGAGIRVTGIHPGMVRTAFFDDLEIAPGASSDCAIEPDDIAHAVAMVVDSRPGTCFDEIRVSPQKKQIEFRRK